MALEALEDRTLLSTNINVSNAIHRQEEPHIAINPLDPLNLVVAANEGISESAGALVVKAYSSRDGGLTWRSSPVPMTVGGDIYTRAADPSVAFDSQGNVYVSYVLTRHYLRIQALAVAKSTDGGETFSQVSLVQPPNGTNDHPWLVIDKSPTSPYQDTLYVSWVNRSFEVAPAVVFDIELSRSTDGGQTWSPAVKVDDAPALPSGIQVNAPIHAVGPDGTVYVTWPGDLDNTNGGATEFVDISTDGGQTFGQDIAVTQLNTNADTFGAGFSSPAQPSRVFRGLSYIPAFPALDTDRSSGDFSGRLYLVYADAPDPIAQPFYQDIFLQFSDDHGQTWSPRILVNDGGPGNSSFFPSLSVDPVDGTVVVSWYDTRRDAANDKKTDIFLTIGTPTPDGVEFGPNLRVTEEQSDESVNNLHGQGSYGDYAGLVAFGGVAYPVWTDARLSNFPPASVLREEIYTAIIPYGSSLPAHLPASAAASEPFTSEQVAPLLTEAATPWQRTGTDVSALSNLDIRIADLGGTLSDHSVWLEIAAAGWGWFVDKPPWEDSEFLRQGNQGQQRRIDLFSVLEHEVGHLLGKEHEAAGVMQETLAAGTRPAASHGLDPDTSELASDALFALLAGDEETPLDRKQHLRSRVTEAMTPANGR